MSNSIETLRDLAMKADESYLGTHPRDSKNWQANEAFCLAATPAVILRLCEVAEKARAAFEAQGAENFAQSMAALRSALSALDKGNTL